MLSERDVDHLQEIRRQIELTDKFLGDMTFEEFEADDLRQHTVVRCLEIISEASRRLPDEVKERHPNIQWRAMAGAGNIYRHGYEEVLAFKVWETVKLALPELRQAINRELSFDG
jgi:uncharacterized protein with HEPN domain